MFEASSVPSNRSTQAARAPHNTTPPVAYKARRSVRLVSAARCLAITLSTSTPHLHNSSRSAPSLCCALSTIIGCASSLVASALLITSELLQRQQQQLQLQL